VLQDIKSLLLRLALGKGPPPSRTTSTTVPGEKRRAGRVYEAVVQRDARHCLLMGLSVFYPTQDKILRLLQDLLNRTQQGDDAKATSGYPLPTMTARFLLDELLGKLSEEFSTELGDMLFPPLSEETEPEASSSASRSVLVNEPTDSEPEVESIGKLIWNLVELAEGLLKHSNEATILMEARTIHNLLLVVQRNILSNICDNSLETRSLPKGTPPIKPASTYLFLAQPTLD